MIFLVIAHSNSFIFSPKHQWRAIAWLRDKIELGKQRGGFIFPSTLWTPEIGPCLIMMVELHSRWHCAVRSLVDFPPSQVWHWVLTSTTTGWELYYWFNICGLNDVYTHAKNVCSCGLQNVYVSLDSALNSCLCVLENDPYQKLINQGKFTSVARATIFCNKSIAAMDRWPAKITN